MPLGGSVVPVKPEQAYELSIVVDIGFGVGVRVGAEEGAWVGFTTVTHISSF